MTLSHSPTSPFLKFKLSLLFLKICPQLSGISISQGYFSPLGCIQSCAHKDEGSQPRSGTGSHPCSHTAVSRGQGCPEKGPQDSQVRLIDLQRTRPKTKQRGSSFLIMRCTGAWQSQPEKQANYILFLSHKLNHPQSNHSSSFLPILPLKSCLIWCHLPYTDSISPSQNMSLFQGTMRGQRDWFTTPGGGILIDQNNKPLFLN